MSTKKSQKKKEGGAKSVRLTADDVFNLMDFDQDGKIGVTELKEAVLGCGIPADKQEIETYADYYTEHAEGKVDLKSFKGICRELKPDNTNMSEFYEKQFKVLAIDQDGLVDVETFKDIMKGMGQKMSETNLNMFLKSIRKEDGGKIKIQSVIDKLASLNVLS